MSFTFDVSLIRYVIFGFVVFLMGILIGLLNTVRYDKNVNDEHLYGSWNTICCILNHTYVQHQCKSCVNEDHCSYKTCYDEIIVVNYKIFNETIVTSTIATKDMFKLQGQVSDLPKNSVIEFKLVFF
jgi:hypothetical protein